MARVPRPALLLVIAFSLAACGDSQPTGGFPVGDLSDEEALRQMEELGLELLEQEDYEAIYQMMEPAFRDECSFERFVRLGRFGKELDDMMKTHERDGEIVSIEVEGDRAVITTLDYSPARDELDEDTSESVKIGNRWFAAADEEGIQVCQSEMFADDAATDASLAVFTFGLLTPAREDEPFAMQLLVSSSFTERFNEECPFSSFADRQDEILERFRQSFGGPDPFSWDFQTSADSVSISSDGSSVADLALESGEWKIDAIAGISSC